MNRTPRATEIDKKLRDDFRRLLKDYGITTQETDPVLAVIFRTFAAQVAEIYDQASTQIPSGVIDELMAGLGMPERTARAAQTVVNFSLKENRDAVENGTELIAETSSREKLNLALDTTIQVSTAQIALVAIYRNGSLALHHGTELPKEFEDARPSYDPVQVDLGPNPAIFLAVDVSDDEHLNQHGLYFDIQPEARDIAAFLKREVWCLIDNDGEMSPHGLLRPRTGNAGVRMLDWLISDSDVMGGGEENVFLPEGFYGSRVFMLPQIPVNRRYNCRIPRNMDGPLQKIFSNKGGDLFDKPRAWFRIGLPHEAATISEDLVRIVLHCTTASNVETLNQTVRFENTGVVIPVNKNGGRPRKLVKVVSLKGERGIEYISEYESSSDDNIGRYRLRNNQIEIEPSRNARLIPDSYANIRLMLCNGAAGNEIAAGSVTGFLNRLNTRDIEMRNLTMAAGGNDGETFYDAKTRFAESLLARDRPITLHDLDAVVKTFEPKIQSVKAESGLERSEDGLHRMQKITVTVDRNSFLIPEEETEVLKRELEYELQQKSLLGLKVRVKVEIF